MIRSAAPADIPAIGTIYEHILDRQDAGELHTGWIRGVYPTESTARAALLAGALFVYEREGTVLASARINQEQMPAYEEADWRHPAPPEQVMVLHTLTVEPAAAGQGIGRAFVRFYEAYAREKGCLFLRMDTNAINTAARRLYASLGYLEAGVVPCVFNGIPDVHLVCLEKKLPPQEEEKL